jgi:hypothetical protein
MKSQGQHLPGRPDGLGEMPDGLVRAPERGHGEARYQVGPGDCSHPQDYSRPVLTFLPGPSVMESQANTGTHTGEFAGIQATGRAVRVPYSVVYDLRADKISALRIYFPMSLLVEQLTG